MTMATPAAVEAEIRALMRTASRRCTAKDDARMVSHHAPDVVAYDLLEPFQYKGAADLQGRAQQWFDGYNGPMTYRSAIWWSCRATAWPSATACITSRAGRGPASR